MLPPCNFYWFRIDTKHMAEPLIGKGADGLGMHTSLKRVKHFLNNNMEDIVVFLASKMCNSDNLSDMSLQ